MAVGDHAASGTKADHRRMQHFRKPQHLVTGLEGARPDEDHRPFRPADRRCRLADGDIRHRVRMVFERSGDLEFTLRHELLPGHFDRCRAGLQGAHLAKRMGDGGRSVRCPVGAFGRLGDAGENGALVAHLVQMAAALVEKRGRYLPGQAQNRLVAAPGSQERGAGVEHARPGHDGIDTGIARGAGVTERHVGACLLVPRRDHPHAVALKGVEQAVELGTRYAEDGIHIVGAQ